MRIDSLDIRQFRNLDHVHIEPASGFNVLVGANGQGKTNLIEAVYLLSTLKSFRSFQTRDLIQNGARNAIASAWVDRGGRRREVRVTLRPGGRKVELNNSTVKRLRDFFGAVNTVAFSPEDIGVLRGSPGDRRTFLDRMIFNAQPVYADEMSSYEDALKQRNALLKDEEPDRAIVEVYDAQLIEYGVKVMRRRSAFVRDFAAPFARCFEEIFGESLDAEIGYVPHLLDRLKVDAASWAALIDDEAALRESFANGLERRWKVDSIRGFTTTGPHRDDLDTRLEGEVVKTFASQGQHRAFVLALKIAEIRELHRLFGFYPILLLDDVSSELDQTRNERLFDFLARIDGQVFVTTTDADYIRLSIDYARFDVRQGSVTRSA